eukprot:144711_1
MGQTTSKSCNITTQPKSNVANESTPQNVNHSSSSQSGTTTNSSANSSANSSTNSSRSASENASTNPSQLVLENSSTNASQSANPSQSASEKSSQLASDNNSSQLAPDNNSEEKSCLLKHDSWQDAVRCVVDEYDLTQTIDADFIKSVNPSLKPSGNAVMNDKIYRILYNQCIAGDRNNYDQDLLKAITSLRPGKNGVNYQVTKTKPYSVRAVIIPTDKDTQFQMLFANNKPLLSQSMVKHAVYALHQQLGHLNTQQFTADFKCRFECPMNKDELKLIYESIVCDECTENNRVLPKRKHTNWIPVARKRELLQIDFIDAKKFFTKEVRKQMDKSPNNKIISTIDTTDGDRGAAAVTSENAPQTKAFVMSEFDEKGPPEKIVWDCGAAFRDSVVNQSTKNYGVKIRSTKPRTPEENAFIESSNKTWGQIWKRTILAASVEERENWGAELVERARQSWFECKFRKFGGKTVFEMVYGYKKDIIQRKALRKKKEQSAKELSVVLNIGHLSKETKEFICHEMVDMKYQLVDRLVRTNYQLQKNCQNADRLIGKGDRQPKYLIKNGHFGWVRSNKSSAYSQKVRNQKVMIISYDDRNRKYKVDINWYDLNRTTIHTDILSVHSIVPDDQQLLVPLRSINTQP